MSTPGIIQKEPEGFKVTFERLFSHPILKVWEAITDPEQMAYWFTDIEMDRKTGGEMRIIFRDTGKTVSSGKILEIEKPRKFVWTWEGELAVWELFPLSETSTKLVFTYSKLTEEYANGATAGFHTLLNRLELYLQGVRRTYPFGTETNDPEHHSLREEYALGMYDSFPELEKYHPITLEKEYDIAPQTLWEMISLEKHLKQWYFDFKGNYLLKPGHVFEWYAGEPSGRQWLHRGKILEVTSGEQIVHSWEFPGHPGKAVLHWEIVDPGNGKSLLRLKFDITEPFDPEESALRRRNFVAGWHDILEDALPGYLDSRAPKAP